MSPDLVMGRAGLEGFGDVVINCTDSHTHKWSGSVSPSQIQPFPASGDCAKGAFILAQMHLTFAEILCVLSCRRLTSRRYEEWFLTVLTCSLACIIELWTEQLDHFPKQ